MRPVRPWVWALAVLVALPLACRQAPRESSPVAGEIERVRALLARGAYADAETRARQLQAATRVELGARAIDVAQVGDVLVETLIRNGRSGVPATLTLAEQVVTEKQRQPGLSAVETAASLHNLGMVRIERGEFVAALALLEQSLAIRSQHLPQDASPIADSLDQIGLALIRRERFKEAKERLQRAVAIRETHAAREPLRLARTLELMVWLHRYSGDFGAAHAPLDRASEIARQFSPEHPDTASLLQLSGDVLWHEGQIDRAKAQWTRGLALLEGAIGRDHPATVGFERRLALASDAQGERSETRRLLTHALETADRWLAPCNPELLAVRVRAAGSLMNDGEFAEARRRYQQSLAGCEACLGPDHSRTATIVYNLAVLEHEMGNEDDAERLHTRAIDTWSSQLGPTHAYVARGLDGLAEVAAARGELKRAGDLYLRALDIRRRLSADHPDVAWTLTNLARVTADSGDLAAADRYLDRAIAIFSKTGAADEPDHFARVLALRGEIRSRRGDYASARASFAEALARRQLIFGPGHPLAAESQAHLAAADFRLGATARALEQALSAERTARLHLQFTVRFLPERQALAYASKRPPALDIALSIAESATGSRAVILNELIQSRGVILDELVARARASRAPDPKLSALTVTALHARQRLANLIVKSLEEPVSRELLDQAREQKEEAERTLAETSAEGSAELIRARIGLKEVAAALPPNAGLVSFVVFERTSIVGKSRSGASATPIRSYGAFVHHAAEPRVTFVRVGTAASIEAMVQRWRSAVAIPGSSHDYQIAGAALRRAIWDPLTPHLEGLRQIFIVPDGVLNTVNVAALPNRGGTYLAEGSAILHYLSTERDLVMPVASEQGRGLLAVGGAAFDGVGDHTEAGPLAMRSGCGGLGAEHFVDLPGSRREVEEIGKFWPAARHVDATILSGSAATETAVKKLLAGRRILHFATHGFFLGDCSLTVAGTRSVGGLARISSASRTARAESPLLLAGLAFAGANQRRTAQPYQDDGILTAEEIASLNLAGVEWAVLSACDTGLGEIKAGEGVLGLRRAFQIAGVRTVIMSLWSVEDRSAMDWMRALYEGRLQRGLNTAEAVREASLTVLRQRRARGQSVHPFFWAGFVASGDWR